MDNSNYCTRCGADNNRDSYFCAGCEQYSTANQSAASSIATISRLCNLAPDDDGEVFEPMTDAELVALSARFAMQPEPSF